MRYSLENKVLTIYLQGELNSYSAEPMGEEIDKIVASNEFDHLILDLESLRYISSAGLRIILKLRQTYPDIEVINASLEVYDVFQMTGFTSMMSVKKALRKVDVSKAEVIGDGFFSTVYRLDKDTIVKVFERTSDEEQIERELRLAKEAFVLGVPTAISYDIVKAGDKLGVCFEMLDCMSLKTAILTNKGRCKEYLDKYVALLKKINTTECFNPLIPDIKKYYFEKLEKIKPYLEDKYYQKLKTLLTNLEDRKTFVHGDCHFKNIMVQNDELLLIDMDTLSVGHPIFELAAIYAPYCAFNEDDPGNSERFFGISSEDAKKLYETVMNTLIMMTKSSKIRLKSLLIFIWCGGIARMSQITTNV